MTLQRGDHVKRGGGYLTILAVSACGRYALCAYAKGKHIREEYVVLKGLRKGTYNVTKHSRRWYKGVLVIEP